jgi:HAD superfamily hydrolase (TIGR01509 family)
MLSDIEIGHYRTFGFVVLPAFWGDLTKALADEVNAAITDAYQATYDQCDTDGLSGHYLPMASRYTRLSASLVCDDHRFVGAVEALLGGPVIPQCPEGVLYFFDAGWHNDDGIGVEGVKFATYFNMTAVFWDTRRGSSPRPGSSPRKIPSVGAVGVILDSGGVLIRPVNGRWFPPPAFLHVLKRRALAWDMESLDAALQVGGRFLDEVHSTPQADPGAERLVWLRYHQLVLDALRIEADSAVLAEEITDLWETEICVEPYPWTMPTLVQLHGRDIRTVILSDAWPSLRRWFTELGLSPFVDAMVISAEEGITKPDARVFNKARRLLGPQVDQVIFVDDYPGHVQAASP